MQFCGCRRVSVVHPSYLLHDLGQVDLPLGVWPRSRAGAVALVCVVLLGSGNRDFVPAFAPSKLSVRAKPWCVAKVHISVHLSVGMYVCGQRQQISVFISGKSFSFFSPSLGFTKSCLVSLLSLGRRKEVQVCGKG